MDQENRRKNPDVKLQWIKGVLIGLALMIVSGLLVKSYKGSLVAGHSQYRFNMAMIAGTDVSFISFDPTERSILSLTFPENTAINSRTSGEYAISSLYKLGSYNGHGGLFARQKIQGFMRVPVPGYVVTKESKATAKATLRSALLSIMFGGSESNLSRFDSVILYLRSIRYQYRMIEEKELSRAGVIEGNIYHPDRLQEYVGTRLFDWGIGAGNVSVSIINASGENGLGADMADFLSNLGLDVVIVRSVRNDELIDKSVWQVATAGQEKELGYIFSNLFGFDKAKIEQIPEEYRSSVVIKVGKDAKELF